MHLMAYTDRTLLTSVAMITFLASIITMLRGEFAYPLELFLIAMLGVLLVISSKVALVIPRRPGEVGLYILTAIT